MKKIILIGGATGSGKSRIAMRLAQQLNCSIIGADSRQVYKEMSIGTAKPTKTDREIVPHYLVDYVRIEEPYDVARWEHDALDRIQNTKDEYVIVCGGTGFYLKTLVYGIDDMPKVTEKIKNLVKNLIDEEGLTGLQHYIKKYCKDIVNTDSFTNPQRMERAVQIHMQTGHCITYYQKQQLVERPFHFIKFKTNLTRDILYNKINSRVDRMMERGLLDEVKGLYPKKNLRALRSVGYQEIFQYLDGEITLDAAVDKIKQHTRNYAKRQLTWFRNQDAYVSLPPDIKDAELINLLEELSHKHS